MKKLLNELKCLELSNKRKQRLLFRVLAYLDSLGWIEEDNGDYYPLYEAIEEELRNPICCFILEKGGKKCV